MDDVIVHDGPIIQEGLIIGSDKPGLGLELNPDVVKAHLARARTIGISTVLMGLLTLTPAAPQAPTQPVLLKSPAPCAMPAWPYPI